MVAFKEISIDRQ